MKKALSTILAGAMAISGMAYAKNLAADSLPGLPPIQEVEYAVPAAHAPGAEGSFWTTNLKAAEIGEDLATYRLIAVPNNAQFRDAIAMSDERTLSPGQSEHLLDVAGQYLNLDSFSGTLFLDVTSGNIDFDSRTINTIGDAVVGQRIKPERRMLYDGTDGILFVDPNLATTRANPWFTAWEASHIDYMILDNEGHSLETGTFDMQPGQVKQINNMLKNVEPGSATSIGPIAIRVTSTGPISAGVSVVENLGDQDATWNPMSITPTYDGNTVAVSWPGANGSQWKTDVTVFNNHDLAVGVGIGYWGTGSETGDGYGLMANGGAKFDNIVEQYFHAPNTAGSMNLNSTQGVHATARIYTTNADGSTSGQSAPPMSNPIQAGETALLHGLEENANTRTNIGFINPDLNDDLTLEVVVQDGASGSELGSFTKTLAPKEWFQANRLLADYGYEGINGMITFTVTEGEALGYASTVPNEPNLPTTEKNNDPSFQPAVNLGTPAYTVEDFIDDNFPSNPGRFYLDNVEIRAMINGESGTRSYVADIAELLLQATPPPPWTQTEMEQDLIRWADGEVVTGTDDFYSGFDPFQWDGDGLGETTGIRFYYEPTGSNILDFKLEQAQMDAFYNIVRDDFLPEFIENNLDHYQNMEEPGTWRNQDPN